MQWTKEQTEAIQSRDANLLVSAAAGSGKTTLLIERIRRIIIEEDTDVSQLLVLTFTRAAAAEMKDRLKTALVAALGNPQADRQRILNQLSRLGSASISTLHAFCGSILREYFQAAEVDTDFRQGNEAELAIMAQEALEETFEAHYQLAETQGDPDFITLVEMFSGNRDDSGLRTLVEQFYRFLMTLEDPQGWCRQALDHYDEDGAGFWQGPAGTAMRRDYAAGLQAALALLDQCLLEAGDDACFAKTRTQLQSDRAAVQRAAQALSEGENAFVKALAAVPFERYKGCREDKETSDRIRDRRNSAKAVVIEIRSQLGSGLDAELERFRGMKGAMAALIHLTFDFDRSFAARKKDRNILDFNDLEHKMLHILEDDAIAAELKKRYRYVFLDEYQDTNAIQEAILQRIVRGDNYFMVGDVKQSIYRFRLADPTIFIDKYRRFGRGDDPRSSLIALNKNFRSGQGIIDGVNVLFEVLMSPELGEVDYDARARLYRGRIDEGPYRPVRVEIIETGGEAEADAGEEAEAENSDANEQEAWFVASRIRGLVGKPMAIAKEGVTRPLRYGDIGVLMRSVAGRGDVFARVFAQAGIPVYYDGGEVFYQSLEIVLVMNLLTIIDNRDQDYPLMSVLLSPMGGFTTAECAAVRLAGEAPFFYQNLWAYGASREDDLARKIRAFERQLDDWAFDAHILSVEDFLWKLYQDTDYYLFVGALPGGEQRQANLRALIRQAGDYKRSTLKGISYFIRFVDRMKRRSIDDSPPGTLSENDDVVRLMTIHKSKGLEFPVVIVAGMGRQFNTRTATSRVLFHKELGICPDAVSPEQRTLYPTLPKRLCQSRVRSETLSEEMRLLYVAATRGAEELILVGGVRDLDKAAEGWSVPAEPYYLKRAKRSLDWVMIALNQAAGQTFDITAVGAKGVRPVNAFALSVYRGDALAEAVRQPADREDAGEAAPQLSPQREAEILRRLSWVYPDLAGGEAPGKLSVTGVEKLRRDDAGPRAQGIAIEPLAPGPAFLQQGGAGLSGAQRGTATHAFLQGLRFETLPRALEEHRLRPELSEQLERMAAQERLSAGEAQAVDLEAVAAFLEGPLGRRLLAAPVCLREQPFNLQVDAGRVAPRWAGSNQTVILQGMIDCCFIEDGAWVLLDYKTDRYRDPGQREALVSGYRTQLELYAEALEKLTEKPVKEKALVFLIMQEIVAL